MKKSFFAFAWALVFLSVPAVFAEKGELKSESTIDWTKNKFTSSVMLDMDKAGIFMPSGKMTAVNKINTELPDLVKDPLLSLCVDSDTVLADLVLQDDLTLEEITQIVDRGSKTPGVFVNETSTLKIVHTINTLNISSKMVRHKYPYKNPKPVEITPSRTYTGIIIDARGKLPVHGEFVEDDVNPCFFPEIWDENMNLIFEKNMCDPEVTKKNGMVHFDWSDDYSKYEDKIGNDPLHISARKVYGRYRTDPVISRADALKILSVPENLELLKAGKIVVLLDKEKLISKVAVPEKGPQYYAAIRELKSYFFKNEEGPIIKDGPHGIQILYDLKFVADSPELLTSELKKIKDLAEGLKTINADNSYTILVEGHTADVNKPEGQMRLSIQRTQTIIRELVKYGLDPDIFSYRGYGGTQPIASNATDEGRALNRRVIITARPKQTYIKTN